MAKKLCFIGTREKYLNEKKKRKINIWVMAKG